MPILEGVQATPQIGKVPGETHALEIGIEGPFGDSIIGEDIQNFFRDGFPLGQVDDLHRSPIHRIPKKEDFKGRGFRILVHTALGQVHIAIGFQIQ